MFFITLVAVILLPASVINSKPRIDRTKYLRVSPGLLSLSLRSLSLCSRFFISFFHRSLLPHLSLSFFPRQDERSHLCGKPCCEGIARATVIAPVVTARIKADCRAPTGNNELRKRRGTDHPIISGVEDQRAISRPSAPVSLNHFFSIILE